MKQKLGKGVNPTRPNVSQKNPDDMVSLLRDSASLLDIPADCEKELKQKGLEGRWIDIVQYQKNHGFHSQEWQPYKFDCKLASSSNPFIKRDESLEGFLVRKQLVLAVKTTQQVSVQRARLKAKNAQIADPTKLKVREMREYIKQSGLDSIVTDASDDED
jgi:hypothetical protein